MERTVKINYELHEAGIREYIALIGVLFSVAMIVMNEILKGSQFVFWASFLIVFIIFYIVERYMRAQRVRKHNEVVAKGKKIIGVIANLAVTDLGGIWKYEKCFSYTVEYENPDSKTTAKIKTPTVIADNLCIAEDDLPLKVIMYEYGEDIVVDAIVNPPVDKIQKRIFVKFLVRSLPVVAVFVLFGTCGYLSCIGELNLSAIVGFSGMVVFAIIFYFMYHKKF